MRHEQCGMLYLQDKYFNFKGKTMDIEKITTIVGEFMREYAFKDDMTVNVDGEDYDLFDVLASVHNELYKTQKGEYYDYMWHWANKCLADCDDGLFKDE